ncbi:sulfite exporter TauE/SafE family protein [Siminovitchia sediminis]|uniref:Probable membrane transporter protein n=1 Tax=Siminovitchia sediminis TaxID=1274353 RepID=A0ABW4KGW4_9BACI
MWFFIYLLVGFFTGIITGMVSVGGGIIIAGILIFFSGLFHLQLDMKHIAMTTSFYSLCSTMSGTVYYWAQKMVVKRIVLFFGIPALIASLTSSTFANYVHDDILKGIFAFFSLLAAIAAVLPEKSKNTNQSSERFLYGLAVFSSVTIGIVGGMIGVAAGFLYMPIFMRYFKLPVREAVGTGLVVGGMLAAGTIIGKLGGGYFLPGIVLPLIFGGISGVLIGGKLTSIINASKLKAFISVVIFCVSIQMIYTFLSGVIGLSIYTIGAFAVVILLGFWSWKLFYKPKKVNNGRFKQA